MLYFTFLNPYVIFAFFVLLFAFCAHAIFRYSDFIQTNKKIIFRVLMVVLIWSQLARYGLSLFRDGFDAGAYLPFYICRISSIVLLYYIITEDKRVEAFLFYWGATGLAGIIYPNGPIENIANLTETFYIDHFLLGLTPFFLVAHQGFRPDKRNLYTITLFMLVVLLIFIPINLAFGTDFFYTKDQSIFGVLFPNIPDTVFGLNIALSSILFTFAHTLTAYGFFYVYYRYFSKTPNQQVV